MFIILASTHETLLKNIHQFVQTTDKKVGMSMFTQMAIALID